MTPSIPLSRSSLPPISSLIRYELPRLETPAHPSCVNPKTPAPLFSSSHLSLTSMPYRLASDVPNTYPRKWDVCSRTTTPETASCDAVAILATLTSLDDVPRVLLVRQFRPPLNAYSIELPAGLIDPGETPAVAAVRELEEETGFKAKVLRVGKGGGMSTGISSETCAVVEVDIVGKGETNWGENESVEVLSAPWQRLEEALEWMQGKGDVVAHGLWMMAAGWRIARK